MATIHSDPGLFDATTARVRRQYEALPYPFRDPADETERLLITSCDDVRQLNYYCFRGRKRFDQDFRVLVAGGGTGDATIFLAEQLRHTKSPIVHLDISTASIEVARQRATRRGLEKRIQWVQKSLLDLPKLGLEPFDYINCTGVLHHLESPEAGLAAINSVLKPDGGMTLMVYGRHARTGVYQMQELMRLVNHAQTSPQEMIEMTRRTLATLPETNWFQRGKQLFVHEETKNDNEIYDLLLHSQDRPYSMREIYDWLDGAGLQLAEFAPEFRLCFRPAFTFQNSGLRQRAEKLPRRLQHQACELMWGSIIKHIFWVSRQDDSRFDPDDEQAVPLFSARAATYDIVQGLRECADDVWTLTVCFTLGMTMKMNVALNDVTRKFFALVDNRRTMREIVSTIAEQVPSKSRQEIREACLAAFRTLLADDYMLMRHASSNG